MSADTDAGDEWSTEDYLDELEMQLEALQTDLDDNHPDGGPNYAYALGDLRSIQESVDALLDEVSVTLRLRPDYCTENAASDGREVRIPKDVTTARELNCALGVKVGYQVLRINREKDAAEGIGSADDPVVVADGDEFTIVEQPQEASA